MAFDNLRPALVIGISTLLISCTSGSDNASQASSSAAPAAAATVRRATPQPQSTAFLIPTTGREAVLDTDGGSATGATVCDTFDELKKYVVDDDGTGCRSRAADQHIIIVKRTATIDYQTTHDGSVQIRAKSGSWGGFVTISRIVPIVPVGTIVRLQKSGEAEPELAPKASSDFKDQFRVHDPSTARVLAFTDDVENFNLKLEIMDGPDRGKIGWTTENGPVIGDNDIAFIGGLTVSEATPKPDPKTRVFILEKDVRLFHDISVCQDAFNAMSDDDAFKRLHAAVDAGDYDDVPIGSHVHIVDDPQPDTPFLIAEDLHGHRGCVGRNELPDY